MPPKRKSTGARAATPASQQSTLSFHGKQTKVTKPATVQQVKNEKKDAEQVEDVPRTEVEIEAEKPSVAEPLGTEQVNQETATPDIAADPLQHEAEGVKAEDVLGGRAQLSDAGATGGKGSGWVADEEQQARKITETQIKRYWRQKESERLAPRVHQQDLTVYEKVLREWDMSGQYGPCIGIARLKRWKRANVLGLKPPLEVLAVLLREMDAGDTRSQRAYVDELMNSRLVEA